MIQQVLDAITDAAADVRNERGDIVALNRLGFALYSQIHAETVQPPNAARYTFLNPGARDFFVDWDTAATDIVAVLRATVGRNPYDKALSDLVGELSTRSDEFRVRWAAHNVRRHTSGSKRMRHPVVGEIELNYQSFEMPGEPGLRFNVFTAEPDTSSQQALRFLASWAATTTPPQPAPARHQRSTRTPMIATTPKPSSCARHQCLRARLARSSDAYNGHPREPRRMRAAGPLGVGTVKSW